MHCRDVDRIGVNGVIDADASSASATTRVYVSIDIDVLDPAFAPGTGTPEAGGMTSRELLAMLRGMSRPARSSVPTSSRSSPAYDHAEITAVAAANLAYELVTSMAAARAR